MTRAAGLALDVVVADCGGSAERFIDVPSVEDLSLARGARPNAGEAIGLQLQAHAQASRAELRGPARVLDALGDAQLLLHVMPDFVGDHVRLGEITLGTEALRQLIVKPPIVVHTLAVR